MKALSTEDLNDSICVLVATRPSIIKMSPVVKAAEEAGQNVFVVHAGQHYSYELNEAFFNDLALNDPDYVVESTKEYRLHGAQTAEMLAEIESVLVDERPRIILVCGDENATLAGALAARKLHIAVGHVEAGLRSRDWTMPEEHNRVLVDHISEYLFAPTREAKENALKEEVGGRVFVTGNTIVDAVKRNRKLANKKSDVIDRYEINSGEYFVVTAHREENVDSREKLSNLLLALDKLGEEYPEKKIVYPIHPRTTDRLEQFGLKEAAIGMDNICFVKPLGYLDFLKLLDCAELVLTDSGGVQEEACILGIPCVTLRNNTERPETVEVGANMLTGMEPQAIRNGVSEMLLCDGQWENPFGDGQAAKRIVDYVVKSELGTA